MKTSIQAAAIAALVLVGAGCSLPGDGHGGGGMTVEECKAVFVKGYELQGTPESDYGPVVEQQAKACAEHDALSREDYECAIKSTSLEQYQACKVVLDFS